jgi:secreted Zn-dependent insulinase-like peptidase
MQSEVESFLLLQRKYINNDLTEADLSAVKVALINNLRNPPSNMIEECSESWNFLVNNIPFDWTEQVIAEVEKINMVSLRDAANCWIFDSFNRRSISIMINGKKEDDDDSYVVDDSFLGSKAYIYEGIDGMRHLRKSIILPDEKYLD